MSGTDFIQNEQLKNPIDKGQITINDNINRLKEATSLTIKHKQGLVLVLINPHSGRGKSVTIYRKKLLPFLESHNIDHEVFITQSESRVHNYLGSKSTVEIVGYKSIIVVSGDGLFHETVNALMARKDWELAMNVPIGVVPTGSGNGLAYTLLKQRHPDISSKEDAIQLCCEQINRNDTVLSDLVKITYGRDSTIWSFLSIGWGLLSDIDIDSEWLRRLGEIRFTVYGLLRSLTSSSYRGRLSFKKAKYQAGQDSDLSDKSRNSFSNSDLSAESTKNLNQLPSETPETQEHDSSEWVHIEDDFVCLYAVYQAYVSSVTNFSPKSTLTDQLIYLTYIRGKLNTCKVIEFLLAIKDGSHDKLSYVSVVPVTKFQFQPLEPGKVVVDGEVIPWNLEDGPITAEVVPKAMKILWSS